MDHLAPPLAEDQVVEAVGRLKAAGVEYQAYIYPGVNHGFHNDTTPRYDEAAATLSWTRTIEFFRKKLA